MALSNFGSAPGAGHLATALFFQDGAIANEYLYRNAVPGHPELNRMNTTLDMGGNNIAAAGAITASGNITTSADISARNVTATGTVKAGTADVAGETYTGGWFRTRGDTGWYNEKWGGGWYMSDSTWVRSWMNKNVYTGGEMKAGNSPPRAGRKSASTYSSKAWPPKEPIARRTGWQASPAPDSGCPARTGNGDEPPPPCA